MEVHAPYLDELRAEIEKLRQSIKERKESLEQYIEERKKARARDDICMWMDNAIIPFLEGIAESFHEPLIEGVKRLIKDGVNPITARRQEAELAMRQFFNTPTTRVLKSIARPFIRAKTDLILKETQWIREDVLKEEYPFLYEAIMNEKGGKEWLDNLVKSFIQMVRRLR